MRISDINKLLREKDQYIDSKIKSNDRILGISDDSRNIRNGFVFFAVKGLTVDGNDFLDSVVLKGASMIISEEDPNEDIIKRVNFIRVKSSRKALSAVASSWYGNPSDKLKIIGVTGTKGKTTTVHLIYHIMKHIGFKVGMVSSIRAEFNNSIIDTGAHVTNPDVITLNRLLSQMVKTGCKYAVLEVSSHGIDQQRIGGIKFDITVLTNISPEHLDYHKTFYEYKLVKMSFIRSGKHRVIAPKKTTLNILPGKFNNLNAEAAVKAVSYMGVSRNEAIEAVKSFKLPSGRLEEIDLGQPFRVVIDFAHTPDSLRTALNYLRLGTKGRLVSVFGCAGERDTQKRPVMGEISGKLADISVITEEDPRSENVNKIIDSISEGLIKSGSSEFTLNNYKKFLKNSRLIKGTTWFIKIPDRKKAIECALSKFAQAGDTVAFFGKGSEKTMNSDGIHETPWSEHQVVRKYIQKDV